MGEGAGGLHGCSCRPQLPLGLPVMDSHSKPAVLVLVMVWCFGELRLVLPSEANAMQIWRGLYIELAAVNPEYMQLPSL